MASWCLISFDLGKLEPYPLSSAFGQGFLGVCKIDSFCFITTHHTSFGIRLQMEYGSGDLNRFKNDISTSQVAEQLEFEITYTWRNRKWARRPFYFAGKWKAVYQQNINLIKLTEAVFGGCWASTDWANRVTWLIMGATLVGPYNCIVLTHDWYAATMLWMPRGE